MIAVAFVAALFGAVRWDLRMHARSEAYREQAEKYRRRNNGWRSGYFSPDDDKFDRYDSEDRRIKDIWPWFLEAEYLTLSYYPWREADLDPEPPKRLAYPTGAFELPYIETVMGGRRAPRPPFWVILWTWRWPDATL